jgi:hypothetical protein
MESKEEENTERRKSSTPKQKIIHKNFLSHFIKIFSLLSLFKAISITTHHWQERDGKKTLQCSWKAWHFQ